MPKSSSKTPTKDAPIAEIIENPFSAVADFFGSDALPSEAFPEEKPKYKVGSQKSAGGRRQGLGSTAPTAQESSSIGDDVGGKKSQVDLLNVGKKSRKRKGAYEDDDNDLSKMNAGDNDAYDGSDNNKDDDSDDDEEESRGSIGVKKTKIDAKVVERKSSVRKSDLKIKPNEETTISGGIDEQPPPSSKKKKLGKKERDALALLSFAPKPAPQPVKVDVWLQSTVPVTASTGGSDNTINLTMKKDKRQKTRSRQKNIRKDKRLLDGTLPGHLFKNGKKSVAAPETDDKSNDKKEGGVSEKKIKIRPLTKETRLKLGVKKGVLEKIQVQQQKDAGTYSKPVVNKEDTVAEEERLRISREKKKRLLEKAEKIGGFKNL